MAFERSRIRHYLIYLAVRSSIALLQAMTDSSARLFGDGFGWLAYQIDRRHRRVADENLQFAFPHLGPDERDRIIRRCFRHFTQLIIEIARLVRKLHVQNWRQYVDLIHGERVVGAMTSGRSAMIVTGHFGNWELAGYALGLFGFQTYAVARTLDNPYLERLLRRFRERTGQRVLAKKGDFDQMTDLLRSGAVLATLADQDAGARGLFVDFFGRPASTHKAIALLSLEFDVPLIVAAVPRVEEPLHYHIVIADVIDPRDYAGRPDAVREITQRYTSALQREIAKYPEQYFWLHRRWKHQPKASVKRRAA